MGAAAILTRPGKSHHILHYHLGKASEYTIYDAELVGISMAMHLIKTEKYARHNTMIGTDSQAAIKAIQNELSTPGHYIADITLCTAIQIRNQRKGKSYQLTLRWTAGHTGIDENELVDKEAKKAAKGQSSDPVALPRFLHKKLKISTAALKQDYNTKSNLKWKNKWANSKRGKQDHNIDSSSPSKRFLELISNPKLPRQASSLISQLRIAHVPLNRYLFRFKRVDNPRCPACGELSETVEHYLLECPAHTRERWTLRKAIKKRLSIILLLGDHKYTLALKNYLEATQRFKPQQSEYNN